MPTRCYPQSSVALQRAGYLTALMGKYLNGYMGVRGVTGKQKPREPVVAD